GDSENNEFKIINLLEEGYTKDEDKININKIRQAIHDNKKLDEIKNKIKDNINRFRIIGLILKPNTIVKLIGEETINHRLEAQFETENNYRHIADTVATYYSTLHFDNEGKITHRRVKKVDEYKYSLPER